MKTHRFLPIAVAALALAACDAQEPTGPDVRAGLTAVDVPALETQVPGVEQVVGETGPGSMYALYRPANWNGELVIYTHGYVQPFLEPSLISPSEGHLVPPFRDNLLMQGFAVAYSGWSETGYAVKDGAQRTHQLNGLFDEAFGTPTRRYLVGLSLGGLVVNMLSEKFPSQYDGTLSMCGVMAGGRWNAEYIAHIRVLFDALFDGALPGTLYEMPAGYYVTPGSPAYYAIAGALISNPAVAAQLAAIDQVDLKYASGAELVEGLVHALGYQVNGANALTARLHGHGFFDNATTQYSVDSVAVPALNAAVARFTSDPSAVNYMEHWWTPTGRIAKPFITLHTTRDPLVPRLGQDMFAAQVQAAGTSDLLLQREVNAFGHCTFSGADIFDAFGALVYWVRTGQKPAA